MCPYSGRALDPAKSSQNISTVTACMVATSLVSVPTKPAPGVVAVTGRVALAPVGAVVVAGVKVVHPVVGGGVVVMVAVAVLAVAGASFVVAVAVVAVVVRASSVAVTVTVAGMAALSVVVGVSAVAVATASSSFLKRFGTDLCREVVTGWGFSNSCVSDVARARNAVASSRSCPAPRFLLAVGSVGVAAVVVLSVVAAVVAATAVEMSAVALVALVASVGVAMVARVAAAAPLLPFAGST